MMFRYLSIPLVLVSLTTGGTLRAATKPHAVPASETNVASIPEPRSIDQELDHLTKELELTAKRRKQIKPLLQEHHSKIQDLLDKNPKLTREDLRPQIHAISEETHREIEALLTEHQKQLAKTMQKRMHRKEGDEPPAPTIQPSAGGPSAANTTWTNEDLERLSSIPGLISVVGQSTDETLQDDDAPGPDSVTEDPEWYAEQADQLNRQLESEQADLRDYIQALQDTRELNLTTSGTSFDELDLDDTPDETIDILESQVRETQSELGALEDLARRNDIEPGVLRGQWQDDSADTEDAPPEQSQSDVSVRGGDL